MEEEEKKSFSLSVSTTKDIFTINGCGKFQESKKHLNKLEALYLYAKLHEWLNSSK